jgi:hypothetical protein
MRAEVPTRTTVMLALRSRQIAQLVVTQDANRARGSCRTGRYFRGRGVVLAGRRDHGRARRDDPMAARSPTPRSFGQSASVNIDAAVPVDLDGEFGSLAPFAVLDELADAARFAFIVEMDHFVHEKYEFRLLCARYLASRGWRRFGEEIDWRQGERMDRYLTTGNPSNLAPFDEPPWYRSGVMREPTERHERYVKAAMESERQRFAIALRRVVPNARYFGFDVGGGDAAYLDMMNAATTAAELRLALDFREQLMQERVTRVAKDNPHDRIALLAGGTHLMKDDDLVTPSRASGGAQTPSVGHFVTKTLAAEPVLAIWLLQGSGASSNAYLGVPPVDIVPAPGTINVEFAERWQTPCLIVTGGDAHERRITQLHQQVMRCRLQDQTDAVVFAPHVTPLRDDSAA